MGLNCVSFVEMSWHNNVLVYCVLTAAIASLQTEQAIDLLNKVENIKGPNLDLRDKYMLVLNNYSRDLEAVRKLYQKQKSDPVVPRNLPPVSGKRAFCTCRHATATSSY